MKILFIIFPVLAILFSCEETAPERDKTDLEVTLTVNETYDYDTQISGDEDGVVISTQASHYSISEIIRDQSTNFSAVYRYQPELDFVGTDHMELKLMTGSDGASEPTHIEFVEIIFNITE